MKLSMNLFLFFHCLADVLPSPSLEWSYAEGVVDLIVTLTSSLLQQLDLDRVSMISSS